jgi:pimeloyl-ACP methyl ester carboxylesterase
VFVRVTTILTALLLVEGCGIHTAAFRDGRGLTIPGSIATMTDVTVGGITQRLVFRGLSASNPAVILLHGGPGASETALFRHYNADLERSFLMVYWEQRATGRSYHDDIPPETMTIDRFVRDLDEVVEIVRRRFQKDRVVLLGHSWGTALCRAIPREGGGVRWREPGRRYARGGAPVIRVRARGGSSTR